jgi:hypothetical protein
MPKARASTRQFPQLLAGGVKAGYTRGETDKFSFRSVAGTVDLRDQSLLDWFIMIVAG